MPNVFDYLKWRGDIPFTLLPMNEIDNLIFSELVYIDLDSVGESLCENGITLQKAGKLFFDKYTNKKISLGVIVPDEIITLLKVAMVSPRYKDVKLSGYRNKYNSSETVQFAAVTFDMCNKEKYIAFRGTDDTIAGWHEDFNFAIYNSVPAQIMAKEYVEEVFNTLSGKFYIGGHSKGGNLAVYGGCMADINTDNLLGIINNDGPGFNATVIKQFNKSTIAITKNLTPEHSIVGSLFEKVGKSVIVKSSNKGLWQHDALSWQTNATNFKYVVSIDKNSKRFGETLKIWMNNLEPQEKKDFIDSLFILLKSTNAETLTDLLKDRRKLLTSLTNFNATKKGILGKSLIKFFEAYEKTLKSYVDNDIMPIKKTKHKDIDYNFTLSDYEGKDVSLTDFLGKKTAVYFYMKDNTTGCTREALEINKYIKLFKDNNINVIGISKDSCESHKKFIEKFSLEFPLLCDTNLKVAEKFNVINKKTVSGQAKLSVYRSIFLFDENQNMVLRKDKIKPEEAAEIIKNTFLT